MIIARRNESVVEVRNRINGAFVRGPIVVGVLLECHMIILRRVHRTTTSNTTSVDNFSVPVDN